MRTHEQRLLLPLLFLAILLVGCGAGTLPSPSPSARASPMPLGSADIESARQALETFFLLLHDQRYADAVSYYGGSYDVLGGLNPDIAPDDYAALFRNGCTINGFRCLRIRAVVEEEALAPTEFKFVVEFANDDGTLFEQGPSGGETEPPPRTRFVYAVEKVGDRFLVQDLPPYLP